MLCCIRVSKQLREFHFLTNKVVITFNYALRISICYNSRTIFNDFSPFCLRAKDHTRPFKEEGFFLNASAISHYNAGILFKHNNLEE